MRDLKIMTGVVYFCVAGVVVSLGGGIYAAVQKHREASQPRPNAFPTPAAVVESGGAAAPAQTPPVGALPTPAGQ